MSRTLLRGSGLMAAMLVATQALAVDFDRDVAPLLTSRCLKCHGAGEAEGGLRLTDRTSATKELESGARAVVPGHLQASELLRRVAATNADERMPPEGPPLSAEEIETLRSWIAAGADWPEHWAYRPLQTPRVPVSQAAWSVNAIDDFVLATLTAQGLTPAPQAERRTLLRRLYLDLLGLPPTADEYQAFEADASPIAYERVVERLLASPHYGERWARHWMDIVHFAETHGHDQDRPRDHAWHYRDYVIRTFNSDVPYARFVREQVAGDVLAPEDPWALIATGFLAAGPWDESSLRDIREDTLDREIARYIDRDDIITTVMSTFNSSTVHCARCHDHKFDPIPQADYYALQAVFAATDKANRAFDFDPALTQRRTELTQRKAHLPALVAQQDAQFFAPDLWERIAQWEQTTASVRSIWQPIELAEIKAEQGCVLTVLDDGSVLSSGPRPERDVYHLTFRTNISRLTGFRLELLPHESLSKQGPGRQDNGNLHVNEVRLSVRNAASPADERAIRLTRAVADFNQQGWSVDMAIDDRPATAWGIYPEVGKPHWGTFELESPLELTSQSLVRIELQQSHGGGHLIGRLRLSVTDRESPASLDALELAPAITAILAVPATERTAEQRLQLAAWFVERELERELAALPPSQWVYCGTHQFTADGSFRPSTAPREVHRLHRGDITQPRELATPGALSCLSALPSRFQAPPTNDGGTRRLALADWLASRDNVLTWRSIANRVWHYHFGRGLVDSPNDFGRMGAAPTHPELLDWLACQLRDGDGSLKELHRLIVTSATYRQASAHRAACAAVDADNRWLWRANRQRLDAESIRDSMLLLSGALDTTMGGPSARQFNMSAGVHVTPHVDYLGFDVAQPANRRRSVYRFIFRTLPDPFMEALDCPDGSQLAPKRGESLTALQTLASLNDKLLVHLCEHLATTAQQRETDTAAQLEWLYRSLFGRLPNSSEAAALQDYAAHYGLANTSRVLMNTNEFIFVD